MLVLHIADALQDTPTNGITQVLSGCFRMDVSEVDGTVEATSTRTHATCSRSHKGHRRSWGIRVVVGRERIEKAGGSLGERVSSDLDGGLSSRCRLRHESAAVLAIIDTFTGPSGFRGQCIDNLCGSGDGEEMDEADTLVPDNLDLVDEPKAAKIVTQLCFGNVFVQAAEIDVARGITLLDSEKDRRWHGAGLSPSDLEFDTMQRELLEGGIGVERSSGSTIEEGNESTRFLSENANRFNGAKFDETEEFVDEGVRREVSHVYSTTISCICRCKACDW